MPAHTKRTKAIEDEVISRMSDGEPLTVICRSLGFHHTTWRDWCVVDDALNIAHGRAREAGYDAIAERIGLTLRGKTKEDGGESTGDVQRDKAIAEYDLKLLAKWDPRRYGDKIEVGSKVEGKLEVVWSAGS